MEKIPLKLKLKLGSGGPSTPEQKKSSPVHPTIISNMAEEDQSQPLSDEEVEEEECAEDGQGEEEHTAEEEGRSRSRHSHHDEGAREKHKKSKKKKKKKEREKDKERHKHRHHREKVEEEVTDEPPSKKQHVDVSASSATPKDLVQGKGKNASAALTQLLEYLLKQLEKKDPQQVFAWPVTDAIAPGYSSIISQPMDFSTMKQKIEDNCYTTLKEFESDFELMCNNCMTYNQQDTIYYKAAKKLLHIGLKIMAPEKVLSLKRELPSMTTLSKEQLGFDINPLPSGGGEMEMAAEVEQEESMEVDVDSKEPLSKFEALQDDMTSEEILEQVQTAAGEAAEKLTLKKPASTVSLGFLRQRGDGTTTLSFLTGCEGNDPNLKEKPVSLGLLTGKLTQGSSTLHNYRDDKRNMAKPVKPLYYGSYSSFCPSYDSTFANLTKEESEMVYATYGNETAVQYAESICDFSQDCDMAMHLVDQLLNLLTHQQHSRTKSVIEERRRMQEEEERINSLLCPSGEMGSQYASGDQKGNSTVDFSALRTLSDLGIDTNFLGEFEEMEKRESVINSQLEENANLLESLAKEQKERLSRPAPTNLNNVPNPSSKELNLVEKVTDGLTMVAKQVTPGALAPVPIVRRAMGITMHPVTSEPSEQIEVDIEGTSSQEEATPPPSGSNGSQGDQKNGSTDLESQLRHILNQTDATSPPPVVQGSTDMTDKKLKEILGN
ncbi:bromodomain-containing protein 7 isoform X1 [Penaeus vannamei]|uniref:bromodomain-containing protein 7 isoform X1 n=2 Tax=Penaeus vannamei TaxID=6689 RepID=UPI000F66C70B|nr:bromodomain-containing protein 7-like isoform X2 [Penaeus vannamei]